MIQLHQLTIEEYLSKLQYDPDTYDDTAYEYDNDEVNDYHCICGIVASDNCCICGQPLCHKHFELNCGICKDCSKEKK